MDEIRIAMDEKILSEIDRIGELAPGSDEYLDSVKGLTELYRVRADDEHNEKDAHIKAEAAKDEKKSRWLTVAANGLLGLTTLALTFTHENGLANKCLRFEETGSFQSVISKNLFSKVFRKR